MKTNKEMKKEALYTVGRCDVIGFFTNIGYNTTYQKNIPIDKALIFVKKYTPTDEEFEHIVPGEKWLNVQAILVENQIGEDLRDDENALVVAENTFGY